MPEDAGRIVEKMLKNWKVSYSLSDYGIGMSTIEELVGRVTGNLANDRLSSQRDIIQTIFKESI